MAGHKRLYSAFLLSEIVYIVKVQVKSDLCIFFAHNKVCYCRNHLVKLIFNLVTMQKQTLLCGDTSILIFA